MEENKEVKETVNKTTNPNIVEVETSIGVWKIKKPKAGVRNRSLAKAETDSGSFKKTTLFMDLLPKCIIKRPDGVDPDVKIEHVLDGLEIEDYDELFEALFLLINPSLKKKEEEEKKT